MTEFDEIDSMKRGSERNEKLREYYNEKVNVNSWLTNIYKNSIINFKDRTEYKKNNIYHRLNGPAIDYKDENKNKYYYNGVLYDKIEDWKKATLKELRRIKLKKLAIKNPD
jgi:hypothetical protein